jgi:NAD(P)-dependent dehydrogenase (short-subunit alcohol dehydrogenase family)
MPFWQLHHHYDALCPDCAALNFRKRHSTARLDGWVALVTGGRVKIGFHTALILLRAGARVLVTTRFPRDAARRFAALPDAAAWAGRLTLLGLDLRDLQAVELLAGFVQARLPRLDLLVNNAAQTVRRPAGFYAHLVEAEQAPGAATSSLEEAMLAGAAELEDWLRTTQPEAPAGLLSPAALTQRPLLPDDLEAPPRLFPPGQLDLQLQQVDLRETNSWRMLASDVPTAELIEVHLVNTLSPFMLASRLRALMDRGPSGPRHIVNVSAMEAQFSRRKKTERHPHTNMAKAALNMFTRTSAADFLTTGIHMNSVDTGWVTDEDPVRDCARKQVVHEFFPPLDAVDGAARVLDPLFTGLATGVHPWGRFFKDYREVEW